jgi:hypothetical protein
LATVAEQLSKLSEKREVLEQFLSYAHQLAQLQGSIEAVQQMLKPSQTPGKRDSAIAEYCQKAQAKETPHLLSALQTLDKAIAIDFKEIAALSKLSPEELIAQHAKSNKGTDVFEAAKARLVEFRRKGQMNVAIRYVLYERGVQQPAAKLPISQEEIADRLDTLVDEEHECRGELKNNMEGMVADINLIANSPTCPEALKQRVLTVKDTLESSLAMIAQGKSLEELPVTVEVIELSSGIPDTPAPATPAAPVQSAPAQQAPAQPETRRTRSFWGKLRIWLGSPWSVRWRDIDNLD